MSVGERESKCGDEKEFVRVNEGVSEAGVKRKRVCGVKYSEIECQ